MTKFCPNCGEENEDAAVFCRSCGHDLKDVDQRIRTDKRAKTSSNALNFKSLAALVVIVAIVGLMAFSFIGNSNSNDSQNITLIKENAYGFTFVNDGVPYYNYELDGVFTNLEGDFQGYDMKARFIDEDGSLVKEYRDDYMKYAFSDSKKSQTSTLASIQTNKLYNVSYIQVEIMDPNGDIVFNESVDFDMAKMDLSGLEK